MDRSALIQFGIDGIREIVTQHFAFQASTPEDLAREFPRRLPGELAEAWEAIYRDLPTVSANPSDERAVAQLLMACGRLAERLENLRDLQLAAVDVAVAPDGTLPGPVEPAHLDAIASFIVWRDRLFRQVADYTLKALLLFVAVFLIGMMLGLV